MAKVVDEDLLDLQSTPVDVANPEEDEKAVKTKKPLPKVPLIIGGIVVLLIIVLVVKGVLSSGKSNIFDVTQSILENELGTFSYTIEVHTSEAGSNTTQTTEISMSDLNDMDAQAEDVSTEEGAETGDTEATSEEAITEAQPESNVGKAEWGNSEGTATGYWKYPNYSVTVSGTTMSTDPFETKFNVAIATDYYKDNFTDIIVKDGVTYINIEQMRYWLVNSKDSYLVSIGQQLPEGSKYLKLSQDEFYIVSRYAEESEVDLAHTTSIRDKYLRFLTVEKGVMSAIRQDKNVKSQKDGTSTIEISGNEGTAIFEGLKGLVSNIDSVYDSVLEGSKTTYPNEDLTQAKREKDNVIEAFEKLHRYFGIYDLSTTNCKVSGSSREFQNGGGNSQLEAVWNISYTFNNIDTTVGISLARSGDQSEIIAPTDSVMTTETLTDNYLIISTLDKCTDYFNFTDIALEKKLEITPSYIKNNILDTFIELVNESGTYSEYLNRSNISNYIEQYANFVQTDDSTNNEIINGKLVADFFDSVNSVTGGIVREVEKEEDVEEVPQYTQIASTYNFDGTDLDFVANYNTEESNNQLAVIDISFMYHKEVSESAEEDSDEVIDDSISVDLSNFSLHTLLNSNYPANNETILRDYDNGFDFEKIQTEFKIQPNVKANAKLYVVISSDGGYMDLWYGTTNLGELINH